MSAKSIPQLVLATGNPDKVHEFRSLLSQLGIPLASLADFPKITEFPENGTTLAENARLKASGYARQLHQWVLSDDTGLEVDALSGAPGVRSARYAGEGATMFENRSKLLRDLADIDDDRRTARFVCHLAIADPNGSIVAEAVGECRGRIRREPAGDFGFGYDSLFEVPEVGKTLAELDAAVTAAIGHRGQAVRNLRTNWMRLSG